MNGNVCLIFLQKAWLQWKCPFASNFAKPKISISLFQALFT